MFFFFFLFSKIIDERLESVASMSLWKVSQLNSKEWPQILIGSISSLIMGGAMPIFAVLFGEIIGVSAISIFFFPRIVSYSLFDCVSFFRYYLETTTKKFERRPTFTASILSWPALLQEYQHLLR